MVMAIQHLAERPEFDPISNDDEPGGHQRCAGTHSYVVADAQLGP
jgi:hypothetical protein